MSKPELGTKYTCEACAERFYDLNRTPVVCFKCHAVQAPPKPRMYRPLRAASDRGAFGRRLPPLPAEEKTDAAGDLAVDDADDVEPADDDNDLDDDVDVEIEVEVDPDDGKILT